ncbi:vacuolar cation/proton exchanger 3-like isoform X2 [Glycine soja]|uniref:Vacuolar cation/proton exchanger 3 isoform B n=1 Tax=Glycine soja TaxID=3848 RepID=A0A445M290_GLYSO|nr:vacuolar cation/proton exchanger 3 isoform X2 [Glycine max]XP_028236966.1 vacuolar cation/proton exchanger 3-like isoform X2 [Glycine soja]RZC29656.1 Vacuolar cation/proton exchanger 3 isoform B [Glycine soja]|eukprot:XP_006573378.1 vacuolar cation/proton exchanger 3 isoform X2 [Glycine max]
MGSGNQEVSMLVENGGGGNNNVKGLLSKEMRHGRTAHNMSSSSLRKKSDLTLLSKVHSDTLKNLLVNLQEVILGTKLSIIFPAIPLAIVAQSYGFGRPWIFALSLLGLTPLAERVSFLTEQLAYYTGPTVGGLLNATCGNATELIIAIFALSNNKIAVRQADINLLMLFVALLSHLLPVLFHYVGASAADTVESSLQLSRVASIVMVTAYCAYLVFQLWTHRQLFEAQDEADEEGGNDSEEAVIGFWSAFAWLVGMTVIIALLSEYVVHTIEDASDSWGLSVSFLSIILLPIVGNAAEHAGAIIFAFKNKLDISLGVSLGSATQISMFVVPLCVIVAWILGIKMDLNFNILETGSLAVAITITAFTLQDGTSHYMKGLVLVLCYIIIGACFFVQRTPSNQTNVPNITHKSTTEAVFRAQ